jgi:plasmid maintenance system antidote protein VapI
LAKALEIAEGEVAAVADARKPVTAALAIKLAGAFGTAQES